MHDDDFFVHSSPQKLNRKAFEILFKLEQILKTKEIASRKDAEESDGSFLIRTAITAAEESPALFRRNSSADSFLTSTWLSIVKNKARAFALQSEIRPYSPINDEVLREVVNLSEDVKNLRLLPMLLASRFGIILIIEPSFAAMKTDGCALKLGTGNPVIGLALRFNRYDNFWFTLMHEMAHISLHYDRLSTPILDDLEEEDVSDIEVEANRLATDTMVPRNIWRKMVLHRKSKDHIQEFSRQAGVHVAIAAGLIRHREKNYSIYSDIVNEIDVMRQLGVER